MPGFFEGRGDGLFGPPGISGEAIPIQRAVLIHSIHNQLRPNRVVPGDYRRPAETRFFRGSLASAEALRSSRVPLEHCYRCGSPKNVITPPMRLALRKQFIVADQLNDP